MSDQQKPNEGNHASVPARPSIGFGKIPRNHGFRLPGHPIQSQTDYGFGLPEYSVPRPVINPEPAASNTVDNGEESFVPRTNPGTRYRDWASLPSATKALLEKREKRLAGQPADAIEETAWPAKAEAKSKPTPLPNTWDLPNTYDPEQFGYPLPGPNPAWGLAMPKGIPDVSRAYRTKIYANEEDRNKDNGIEKLIFRAQDQAPYTAMGLPWEQNERSQARYVMSHREGNASEEREKMSIAHQVVKEYLDAKKAQETLSTSSTPENTTQTPHPQVQQTQGEATETSRVGQESPSIPQAQQIGLDDEEQFRKRIFERMDELRAIRAKENRIEADDEHVRAQRETMLLMNEADTTQTGEWYLHALQAQGMEIHTSQDDQDSEQPVSAEHPTDRIALVFEILSGWIRNHIVGLIPQIRFNMRSPIWDWIMIQYRLTSPILEEVIQTILWAVFLGGKFMGAVALLAFSLWVFMWVVTLVTRVHMSRPYSVPPKTMPVSSTKPTAHPVQATAYVESNQQSSFRSLFLPLASFLRSLLTLLTSFFGSLLDLLSSFFRSLLNLIKSLSNAFLTFCGDLMPTNRFIDNLQALIPIFCFFAVLAILYYHAELANCLKKLPEAMKSAQDNLSKHVRNAYIRLGIIWRAFRRGPLKVAAWSVLYWTLFLLWSTFMFLAGFGFRDFYDGFQKVTIVSSPC